MKSFEHLKNGDIIRSTSGDRMRVKYYDYYCDGDILCFVDTFEPTSNRLPGLYPAHQFNAEDWEVETA